MSYSPHFLPYEQFVGITSDNVGLYSNFEDAFYTVFEDDGELVIYVFVLNESKTVINIPINPVLVNEFFVNIIVYSLDKHGNVYIIKEPSIIVNHDNIEIEIGDFISKYEIGNKIEILEILNTFKISLVSKRQLYEKKNVNVDKLLRKINNYIMLN